MGSPSFQRTRRNQRSMSSNQPGISEEDDERFSLGVSAHGDDPTILVNLRRSMAEHLRQKLQEKLYRQFGEFLTICSISQNPNGKLEALECEVKDEEHHRIVITCEPNNKFVVFTSARSEPRDESFNAWLEAVMSFGVSGRCSSLSALFQFMYQRRTSNSSSSWAPTLMEPSFSHAIAKAQDAACNNRPHQAIDVISEAFRAHGVSLRAGLTDFPVDVDLNQVAEALFIRCSCYAKAGMFTLALADADVYVPLFGGKEPNSLAEVLFWRGFSLEGLLRPREALDSYMAALEADPSHDRAQQQFHVLFEAISRQQNDMVISPTSSQRRGPRSHRRERVRSQTNDSVADSHTSGTTASRRSSRSTTPTSSGSEHDE